MRTAMYKAIDFLGIKVSAITKDEIVDKILEFALTGKFKTMTYVNAHCVNISFRDPEYKRILKEMDLVYAGGMGVVWASKLSNRTLVERVNILDFFDKLAERLKANKIKIYLLGAKADVVQKAKDMLKKSFSLEIVGYHSGFFNEEDELDIVREINILKPNILIVGMGVPKQEKWIYNHLNKLDVNLCWAVGAAFDWLSGYRKRAPRWMIECGFEWLHRLYQQPKRLWKRYLAGNPLFVYRVLKYKLKKYEKTS